MNRSYDCLFKIFITTIMLSSSPFLLFPMECWRHIFSSCLSHKTGEQAPLCYSSPANEPGENLIEERIIKKTFEYKTLFYSPINGTLDLPAIEKALQASIHTLPLKVLFLDPSFNLALSFSNNEEEFSTLHINNFKELCTLENQEQLILLLKLIPASFFSKVKFLLNDFNKIPDHLFQLICAILINPSTTDLYLANSLLSQLTPTQCSILFSCLNNHVVLRSLILSEIPLYPGTQQESLHAIFTPLKSCHQLINLTIQNTNLNALSLQNIKVLAEHLSSISNLVAVKIENSPCIGYYQGILQTSLQEKIKFYR